MKMDLFYRKVGQGAPLVVLHGVFGASENWLTIAKQLGEDFSVYLLDLRNHGRSPHSEEMTYSSMAEDVRAFLQGQKLEGAAVMGHSMGGKVAMWLALHRADLISRLVVVDIAPKKYAAFHPAILQALLQLDVTRIRRREEADAFLAQYIPETRIRRFLLKNLVRERHKRFNWRIHLQAIVQNLPHILDWPEQPGKFQKPTLFVRGENSDYIQSEDFGCIREQFPRAYFVTIHRATHWVHADQPGVFTQAVRYFLKATDPGK